MQVRSRNGQAQAFIRYVHEKHAQNAIAAMGQGYEICPGEGEIIVKLAYDQGGGGNDYGSRYRAY